MIGVRPMTAEDAAAAAKLEEQAFSEPWSEEAFRETLQYDYAYYYVAWMWEQETGKDNSSSNAVIGICGLRNIAGEGEITNVAVHEDYRRRGVAEALLEEALRKGRELGIRDFTLEVRSSNKAAIHLYEKIGFRKEGIRKNFYTAPTEDAVIMWKR